MNAKHLTRAFAQQEVRKSYLALVPQSTKKTGTLNLPLTKVLVGGEGRMAVHPDGQEAITDFDVLGQNPGDAC